MHTKAERIQFDGAFADFFFDNCEWSVYSLADINIECPKQLKTMTKVVLLIELVKKHKILYDLADEDYKNIRKKDKIWDEIRLELKESGKHIDLAKKKFSFYAMAQFLMFLYFIVWTFIVHMSPQVFVFYFLLHQKKTF